MGIFRLGSEKMERNRNYINFLNDSQFDILYTYYFQTPLCLSGDLQCVNNVKVESASCLKPCSGMIVTSFAKSNQNVKMDNFFLFLQDYNNFKTITSYPSGLPGK